MNYNDWFFNQYRYLKGSRNGKESFNDTKWVSMVDRYKTLVTMGSSLLNDQPFGVMGNNYGFDQLLELMNRSNYSFEDLNESLIDTYNVSLKNAMGKMMVNTETVIFHTRNTNTKNVFSDKTGKYYVVEAPFNQMHFGDRDEFIRQRLHKMHTTENGYYIPINDFITSESISDILGFSIICCVNGYICNDCQIAIDDKGFKFKIKWGYSSDVDFIIYKLEHCFVYQLEVDSSLISTNSIPSIYLSELYSKYGANNNKCLVNIYDKNFISTIPTVPNFGLLNKTGLIFKNLQNKTLDMIDKNRSSTVNVVIYVLKYLQEVPNLYPAINYYDLIDSRLIYTDKHNQVDDINGNRIVSSSMVVENDLEICTPPISLDRSSTKSFTTVLGCLQLESNLMLLSNNFKKIGITISSGINGSNVQKGIIEPLNDIVPKISKYCSLYHQGAILTSLIDFSLVNEFEILVSNLSKTLSITNDLITQEDPDYSKITKYDITEFYGNNYQSFVSKMVRPFKNEKLSTISTMKSLPPNYFDNDNSTRFNRPISEYCFIVLKYNQSEDCWLFDYPTIKRFHGIGNTFYIDSKLNGDEIYKFFVLYTDTENPSETNVEPMSLNTIIDFDLFMTELDKHMGYIRYWDAENKLSKYCQILYNRYDQDTCLQVLSKILKRKIIDNDILHIDPSDLEYELSSINSFNIVGGEDDVEAPFALNYLFYTLSMINGSTDKLQSFFMHKLVDDKFNNRYSDINVSSILNDEHKYPINISTFSFAPTTIDTNISNIPDNGYNMFYGLPYIISSSGASIINNSYPYVFNRYTSTEQLPFISEDGFDYDHYIAFNEESLPSQGYHYYTYNTDIQLGKMFCKYLTSLYSYINEFQTNYKQTFNQTSLCDIAIQTMNAHITNIMNYVDQHTDFMISTSSTLVSSIITDNPFITAMYDLKEMYSTCISIDYQGYKTNIFNLTNDLLSDLRYVFRMYGYDNYALKPIRALYIHLKKINTKMNIYEFKMWLSGIDYHTLSILNDLLANNPNNNVSPNVFIRYKEMYSQYIIQCHDVFDQITDTIDSFLNGSLYNDHMQPIITYCNSIVNTYTFDMYVINDITLNTSVSYNTKPYAILVEVDGSDPHFMVPTLSPASSMKLIFRPNVDEVNGSYRINDVSNVCDYVMFNGNKITSLTGTVVTSQGTTIGTVSVDISFEQVSNTSDVIDDMSLLTNGNYTPFDFENIHESYEVVSNNIINSKRTPMNYEMFIGNHFVPLDHVSEMIMNPPSELPGPIDRVYVSNQMMNRLLMESYGNKSSVEMYFKPSQILHLPINDGVMTSVGGKYFEGQRIYLCANDTKFTFPATITTIDWSESHGFVEAVVDSYNTTWFKITDSTLITKYFNENIECTVIDDNISNFMDEFSNGNYISYDIIETEHDFDPSDENFNDFYSLPGDPIYVTNNAPFVYTRLNYFFNDEIPNRFIDGDHMMYHFMFIGAYPLLVNDNNIRINMISHDFNELDKSQLFPILRTEPNDHDVWDKEREVFAQHLDSVNTDIVVYNMQMTDYLEQMKSATTDDEYKYYLRLYEDASLKYKYYTDFAKRLNDMIEQPEPQTTWFNVRSYEASIVYIENGRAKPYTAYLPNIRYASFSDKIDVYLYDWEHKEWIDPSMYTVTPTSIDGSRVQNVGPYATDDVLYYIDINFNENTYPSKKILIYFGYNKSDIFDDISINDKTCDVRFKPILSTGKHIITNDPYSDIRIRKHFDGYELYKFDESNLPDDISLENGYLIKRPNRNGKYQYSPTIRMCDMTLTNNSTTYDFTQFDLYVRNPFKDTHTIRTLKRPSYQVTIDQPIDGFTPKQNIKLISVSNDDISKYNGCVSSVMFDAYTSMNNNNPVLTITNSSLDDLMSGRFICSVFPSPQHNCSGGLITIDITSVDEDVMDPNGQWIRISDEFVTYKELPNEFIIIPKQSVTIDYTQTTEIKFKNEYIKYSSDTINETNDNTVFNPYEYYYREDNNTRLPLSDVMKNDHTKRLVVDTSTNSNVHVIKTSYIGICRYSLRHIPKNGFIDVTGYICNPLSRNRYEFYVNGKCIRGTNDIIITSPTTLQLLNMTSLKNFELVELVDDMHASNVFPRGPIYISTDGRMFGSYETMLMSKADIIDQDIRFTFNTDQHSELHDYVDNIIDNPNNVDIETDVLEGLVDTTASNDFNDVNNIPTLNGVTLLHLLTKDIGLVEVDDKKIFDALDSTWKYERLTNPFFVHTHYVDSTNKRISLHVRNIDGAFPGVDDPENWICVNVTGNVSDYFSLYISKTSDGIIDDTMNTLKIIPFVNTGTTVLINKSFAGKYLHATYEIANVIRL